MSSRSVPTTIIGPKGLLRDSLASLLDGYSYRVTDSHDSAASMSRPPEEEGARIVLLTVRAMDLAISEAARVRQTCPNCKIVALVEDIPREDFEKLMQSAIDGCVPLHVSQDVLTRTLDLVMTDSARIVVLADDLRVPTVLATESQQKSDPGSTAGGGDETPQPEKASTTVADHDEPILVPKSVLGTVPPGRGYNACSVAAPIVAISKADDDNAVPELSRREKQIIDGLVKGQPNKTIARVCGITEATVKVHMKAILRKVPCSNRTQVAIWALEHAHAFRNHRIEGASPGMAE